MPAGGALRRILGGPSATRLILNDVSLSIYPREFVGLVGGSGAGKSTLLKALTGFAPAQGRVLINGDDLYTNYSAYENIFGYVPQDDIIHGQLSVRGALTYAAELRLPDATPDEVTLPGQRRAGPGRDDRARVQAGEPAQRWPAQARQYCGRAARRPGPVLP